MIPQNPIREMDEFYVKDDKVIHADCESIAADWFKQRDDDNFHKELEQLTSELQLLDEGKWSVRGGRGLALLQQRSYE